jgi:hypothetical protein
MTPRADMVAFGTAAALGERVVPHLMTTGYPLGTAAASAGLLVFLAQDLDRGAQRRMQEITGMHALFRQALLAPDWLGAELEAAITMAAGRPVPADLTLSALDGERGALLATLIDLHTAAEHSNAPEARSMERAILAHLHHTAQARALVIPPQPAAAS